MTTPSLYETTGLSAHLFKPRIALTVGSPNSVVYDPQGSLFETVTDKLLNYSHGIEAIGGFWNASLDVGIDMMDVDKWYQGALGCHLLVTDHSQSVAWEGIVDTMTLTLGPLTIMRGPMTDLANSVQVMYSIMDTSTTPPTTGIRKRTALTEDNDSQRSFGIWPGIVSAAGMTDATATQLRDRWIRERDYPMQTQTLNLAGSGQPPTVRLSCLGYVAAMLDYPYEQTAATGTGNLSDKINDVLDADPNAVFSSANADVTANTLAVKVYERDNKSAWAILKELIALGDATYARYIGGVYEDRKVIYGPIPTDVEYKEAAIDNRQTVQTMIGRTVFPWAVRPGKWLMNTSFLVGQTYEGAPREDQRVMFVESVSYTAPWSLQLRGGKTDTTSQLLGQLGLSGTGS